MPKKYIPENWKAIVADCGGGDVALVICAESLIKENGGTLICKVSPIEKVNKEDEADARIIAAAPLMLKALLLQRKFDKVKVYSKEWLKLSEEHLKLSEEALKAALGE